MQENTVYGQSVILSRRITLRPLEEGDIGALTQFAGDERVARYTRDIPHPLPPEAARDLVTRAQDDERTEDVWVIDGSTSGLGGLLGLVSLARMDTRNLRQSEIGYWIAPAFWNAGLASEAVQALMENNPQGCDTVFAEVFQDNPVSAKVVTNAGFEYLGDAEAFSVARNAPVATWTYLKKFS